MSTPSTTVVIDDQVNGTRQEFVLPVDPTEAADCCIPLARAKRYADLMAWLDFDHVDEWPALGCSVAITTERITARWYILDGNHEKAKAELQAALAGREAPAFYREGGEDDLAGGAA